MPDFSRRHYIKVAELIAQCSDRNKQIIFDGFSELFEEDNSLFDKDKFAEACGMNKEEHLSQAFSLLSNQ